MLLAAGLRWGSFRPSSRNWGSVSTSKGRERKGMGKGKEGDGKGKGERKGRTPVPDCESAKVATLKCGAHGGPPTMPEENSGPWSKKFENR